MRAHEFPVAVQFVNFRDQMKTRRKKLLLVAAAFF